MKFTLTLPSDELPLVDAGVYAYRCDDRDHAAQVLDVVKDSTLGGIPVSYFRIATPDLAAWYVVIVALLLEPGHEAAVADFGLRLEERGGRREDLTVDQAEALVLRHLRTSLANARAGQKHSALRFGTAGAALDAFGNYSIVRNEG